MLGVSRGTRLRRVRRSGHVPYLRELYDETDDYELAHTCDAIAVINLEDNQGGKFSLSSDRARRNGQVV
jgi:hypothetical protein